MPRFRHAVLACALTLASGLLVAGSPAATAAAPTYTTTTLHFKVTVGPTNARQTCDIVGDLYVPKDASSRKRMPAVLSTNGFGGSKDDQAGLSKLFAENGYLALSYSGLGFGGSSCEITLDDPVYDGQAAAQLIDYLGGADGIAFTDAAHTQPVARLNKVKLDQPGDPRVGMFGGSYGGQVQYAAASVTTKLDTIVPLITWNDLSYSLGPNNTDQIKLPGQELLGVSTNTPGSVKTNWALAFSAIGLTGDAANQQPDNPLGTRCPNFRQEVCPALVSGAATGTLAPNDIEFLRDASVASYQDKVKIPTLILQGQADTLFNLNEAVASYRALDAQNSAEVKMSWINYGHSGDPAEGEIDFEAPNPGTQVIARRIFNWFGHHLQDRSVSTGPKFSYFRDWVNYSGIATPAYAQSDSIPEPDSVYYLSGGPDSEVAGGDLVTNQDAVESGTQTFTATPGPTSTGEDPDVISTFFEQPEETEPAQGNQRPAAATYDTATLTDKTDVVGSPQVRLQVQAPGQVGQAADAGKLVIYLKVADVAPSGNAEVVRNLTAPVRVPDVDEPFTVTMPAFVHRFEPGHKIRLVVAGASPNYRGNTAPSEVTIATGDGGAPNALAAEDQPLQSITLPTVAADDQDPYLPGPGVPQSNGDQHNGGVDSVGPPPGSGNNGNGHTSGNSQGNGSAGDRDAAQAAPVVSDASTASTLADTGGPPLGLLGAGLLLVALGAHLLMRRRRDSLS